MKESVFNTHHVNMVLPSMTDEFILYPVSDVHRETMMCDEDRWKGFLKKAKQEIAEGKNVYFLGVGDFNDFAAWGDRKKLRNASLHESTIMELDHSALRHCRQLVDELAFTKGRWIGLIQGNHRWEFTLQAGMEGMSSEDYYAEQLGTRNLGDAAYIRISVKYENTNKAACFDILTHHGKAGGKLAGTTVNQIEDLRRVFPMADMYITGHDHRKVAVPLTSLVVGQHRGGNLKVNQMRQWMIRSGSFLRGYVEGESSYIVRKMLAPTDLGIVKIKCKVHRNRKNDAEGNRDDRLVNDIHVEY